MLEKLREFLHLMDLDWLSPMAALPRAAYYPGHCNGQINSLWNPRSVQRLFKA